MQNTQPKRSKPLITEHRVFSRKAVLEWADSQTKPKRDLSEISLTLARSARRKR